MLSGAEGEARVDLEIDGVGRPVRVVHGRMNEEAAGADRLQTLLALRNPVGRVFEMLDLRIAGAQPLEFRQFMIAGLAIEVSVDQPVVGPGLVGFVGDDDRRRWAVGEKVLDMGDGFALRARARDGDAIAYSACSLASRSLSAFSPRSE
jgi:hypothetical protein